MAVRRETIILELEDNASRGALQAAAALKVLKSSINDLSGSSARARSFQTLSRDADRMGDSFDRAGSSIDRFSGRARIAVEAVAGLGPAIVPLAASAVPVITSLATGIAGAAGAAAAASLAFAGVGDALDALNTYQLEPSADNFRALQVAMNDLGPSGEQFVYYLDSIGSQLESLQRVAGDNMFPGVTAGLESLVSLMPQARDLVAEFSSRLGGLAADGGAALAGPKWEAFFSFLETDAAPIFDQFARATGNVALGLGNLMVAFAPLSRDFAEGMLEASQAFASWSADSSNFEGFIEYVRSIGPEVSDFLGSLAEAAVALTQAVAPWGSVVLPALTTLLDLFTAVAGSPIGPALTTAALAMLALNKAAAANAAVMGRFGPAIAGARTSLGQMKTDLSTVATTWATAGAATERESKRVTAATGRLKSNLAAVGAAAKGSGAQVAAIGLIASGTADKMGLSNTAMLALAGSMAGPWGTAAGAAVGLTMDLAKANDDLKASVEAANEAIASGSLEQMNAARDQLRENLRETTDNDVLGFDLGKFDGLGAFTNTIAPLSNIPKLMGGITGTTGDAADALSEAEGAIENYADTAQAAVGALNELTSAQMAQTQASLDGIDAGTRYGAALAAAAKQAESGTKGFNKFTEAGRANRTAMTSLIEAYNAQDDATKNSIKGYRDARQEIAEFGRDMGLTSERIRELQGTLDKPATLKVNTAQAQDAIAGARDALRTLPPQVQTEIATRGIPRTQAQVDALVAKYRLTEEQRTALVTLKDLASGPLGSIARQLLSLDGRTALITVYTDQVTRRRIIDYGVTKMKGLEPGTNADGGFYANGVRAFADGGWGMDGKYYSRKPQIIPGGANVLWGEKETGWEAYISGKPSEKQRNLEILSMAADRLGAAVIPAAAGGITAYANGGTSGGGRGVGARSLERALGRLEKALDKSRDRLDYWNNKRSELRSDVSGAMTLDWFSGGSDNPFSGAGRSGTAAFAQQQWAKQATNSKRLSATIANLRKNGAGDAFIAEILRSEDPLAAATMFNQQTKAGMRHSQKLFLSATRATNSAAAYTSGVVYGDEQARATKEIRGLRGDVRDVKKAIDRNHKDANKSRDKNGAGKATRSGSRSRTRSKRG